MFFAKKTVVCVFIIREEEEKEDGNRVFWGLQNDRREGSPGSVVEHWSIDASNPSSNLVLLHSSKTSLENLEWIRGHSKI